MAAASLFVGLLLPAAALAAPSEDACAAFRAIPFSTAVPAAMRTTGAHRFEWYSTYDNADGTTGNDLAQNQITITPGTPLYPNNILLRLFRNTTLLADGEVVTVDEMSPTQPATLYIAAYSIKGDDPFLSSFRTWFRYETLKESLVGLDRAEPRPGHQLLQPGDEVHVEEVVRLGLTIGKG